MFECRKHQEESQGLQEKLGLEFGLGLGLGACLGLLNCTRWSLTQCSMKEDYRYPTRNGGRVATQH